MKSSVLSFFYIPILLSNSAYADCGDIEKGQYTCNSDSVSVSFNESHLQNNSIENSDGTYTIYGPYLDLDPGSGSFKSVQLIGIFAFKNYIHVPDINHTCLQSQKFVGEKLFDYAIERTDRNGNTDFIAKETYQSDRFVGPGYTTGFHTNFGGCYSFFDSTFPDHSGSNICVDGSGCKPHPDNFSVRISSYVDSNSKFRLILTNINANFFMYDKCNANSCGPISGNQQLTILGVR